MSMQSWKEQYYPVPARDVSAEDALDHSILKWSGLTTKALEEHKVFLSSNKILQAHGPQDTDCIRIDSFSCALCEHFNYHHDLGKCGNCPLTKVRGLPCDEAPSDEAIGTTPWFKFKVGSDPQPMIDLLNKAKEAQK